MSSLEKFMSRSDGYVAESAFTFSTMTSLLDT
uniref:Uncharacterized protein n=1 Tax=Anguilla anguilla TaxID=7936 RepID=A0A0E9R0J4_ANGAN